MTNAKINIPQPCNEIVRAYAPGDAVRESLKERLNSLMADEIDIPVIVGGQEIRTGNTADCVAPHDHRHKLGVYHKAGKKEVDLAIAAAAEAHHDWCRMRWEDRAAIFLRAADLLAGPWRDTINVATMLGQSKTVFQAEIDAACELIDFFRFNAHYMEKIYAEQPDSQPGMWNQLEHRPLEGFVFAVTPFNFTSIAGNLPSAPVLMGNTVVWKPASSSVYSNYFLMKLFQEAGVPDGVINFVPGSGAEVGDPALDSPHLAGIHFTGSTAVFQGMWTRVGANISRYKSYPRIVGETGGKNFVFVHASADVDALVTALLRGAYEFQGQKCSAASRAFLPASLYVEVIERLETEISKITMGSPRDLSNFMCAVIDKGAYKSISGYIEHAKNSDDHKIIVGGGCDDSTGYFIEPTLIKASAPDARLMCEEIFGPVLSVYEYDDGKIDQALADCDSASPYALTGAVFAQDRKALVDISDALIFSAGNFYINDKPTGAVVGQQPFGGGRASGTNDKAGSPLNLMRWVSPRTIKETFVAPTDWSYPHMSVS